MQRHHCQKSNANDDTPPIFDTPAHQRKSSRCSFLCKTRSTHPLGLLNSDFRL
jgi:hypothetical protein